MGTKNDPGEYDCYEHAEPDEPMFVLLGRDPVAPALVLLWAALRRVAILDGRKPDGDFAKVDEAMRCAQAMERWGRHTQGGKE